MEKRLYKINRGKMVDGVCGGIVAYILCAAIFPREPEEL
nr:PspC domain-containing protein [Oscillibacter sp.]